MPNVSCIITLEVLIEKLFVNTCYIVVNNKPLLLFLDLSVLSFCSIKKSINTII